MVACGAVYLNMMEILLLCDYRPRGASTVTDHIDALCRDSRHKVRRLTLSGDLPGALDLARFDAVIVHYSLVLSDDRHVSKGARKRLREFTGLKVIFIQDEYRWVNAAVEAMDYIRAEILFTCVPGDEVDKVYAQPAMSRIRKVNTLTGFVPSKLLRIPPLGYHERTIDVGYRSRRLSAVYGELGQEKWRLAVRFAADASEYGLSADISCDEADRIYGRRWIDFVRNCRAMLGSESGASFFDFTGEIRPRIEQLEREQPGLPFEEIRDRFFPGQDAHVRMNQISPRCFEAAALRTLMVLYEGRYSGVLQPWRHYVPLKKDHSNMDEVVAVLRDPARWQDIVDRAYEEVACDRRWSYEAFADMVGGELESAREMRTPQPVLPYSNLEFWRVTAVHQTLLYSRRNLREALIKLVERLPPPIFRMLRHMRRALCARKVSHVAC